jgi:carbon monoxide dehydrogenase subunit G
MEVRALHLDDAAKRGLKLEHEVHIGCRGLVLESPAIRWDDPPVLIEREVEIARPLEEVFAFVSDPRNDPRWCSKVKSVEHVAEGRYVVVHKPVPLRPARRLNLRVVASEPPRRMETTQDDGSDVFRVTYELEATQAGTRLRQRSEAEIGAVPRILFPLWRHGIGRDVARQLRDLKRALES